MNTFQETLKELLCEKNLSRLALAKIINISSTTINGYFNNGYYPEIKIAVKIANFFDCSLDYLFGISDQRKNTERNKNKFIENFTTIIKQQKMSVFQTMKVLNMSEYNYYRWRNGLFPKTVNLIEIAKFFNVSLDYLVGDVFSLKP